MTAYLYLLDSPRLELNGNPVGLPRKALALLAYGVLEGRVIFRHELRDLLWPESDKENLRPMLHRLHEKVPFPFLTEERGGLKVQLPCDAVQLRECLDHLDYASAAALLAKCTPQNIKGLRIDSPNFESWLSEQAEWIDQDVQEVLLAHAESLYRQGRGREALTYLRRLSRHNCFYKEVYVLMIRIYLEQGSLAGAWSAFLKFRRVFAFDTDLTFSRNLKGLLARLRRNFLEGLDRDP